MPGLDPPGAEQTVELPQSGWASTCPTRSLATRPTQSSTQLRNQPTGPDTQHSGLAGKEAPDWQLERLGTGEIEFGRLNQRPGNMGSTDSCTTQVEIKGDSWGAAFQHGLSIAGPVGAR